MKKVICICFSLILVAGILCGCKDNKETEVDVVNTEHKSVVVKDEVVDAESCDELSVHECRTIPSITEDTICNNRTQGYIISKVVDLKYFGKYDKTMPYEENHTDGIIYYSDGIYVILENINTNVIKNDNISKVDIWNYDGTEKVESLAITFSAEIKEIEFVNVPLGLKAVDKKVFAIKILPTVDYKNFNNPIEYNKELSVEVNYVDENGTEQIVWVQFEKVVAYT